MTVLHPLNAAPPKGVRLAEASDALEAIHHADCAAAIWQRALPVGFAEWIDGLSPEQLPSAATNINGWWRTGVTASAER